MPITTMRTGVKGSKRDVFVGLVKVDKQLNEVILELPEHDTRDAISCGGLVPLDFEGKRCRVIIELI